MGGGRKRYNILGAYSPDDHEYIDVRKHECNISSVEFIELLGKIAAQHPEADKIYIYLDNAKYFKSAMVREWQEKNPKFCLEPLPPYSPNLNLIERLWRFMKDKALKQFHNSFDSMRAAIDEVLDNLDRHKRELTTLMTERFHIVDEKNRVYCVAA